MTDQQLRDLLEERVADVTAPDLTIGAWHAGRRDRRRHRWVAVGAAAVVVAAIGSGASLLADGGATGPEPAPALPHPPPTGAIGREPDATYEGVPVFWSPAQQDEQELDPVDSPMPPVVDLVSGPLAKHLSHAVAAFAREGDRITLVGPGGGQVSLSIKGLDDVTKPNGYAYRPVHLSMLSPTGEYLVFPQDGSVRVYTVDTGEWRTIDTGAARTLDVTWVDGTTVLLPQNGSGGVGPTWSVEGKPLGEGERPRASPGFDVASSQAYGQTFARGSSSAQSWGMGVPVPVRDSGSNISNPDFVAATVGGFTSLLVMTFDLPGESETNRFKDCCPVAGWLSDDVLVYESKQTDPVLVAWTVGTTEFRRVSRIEGEYYLASFADLG